jgi:hypothetical protein
VNHQPEPLTYAQLVSVAVGILLDLHPPGSEVSEAELDRAARMTRGMNPDVIDEQGLACLRRDLRFLTVLRGIFIGVVVASICDAGLLVEAFSTPAVDPPLPDLVLPVPHVFPPSGPAAMGPGLRAGSVQSCAQEKYATPG